MKGTGITQRTELSALIAHTAMSHLSDPMTMPASHFMRELALELQAEIDIRTTGARNVTQVNADLLGSLINVEHNPDPARPAHQWSASRYLLTYSQVGEHLIQELFHLRESLDSRAPLKMWGAVEETLQVCLLSAWLSCSIKFLS